MDFPAVQTIAEPAVASRIDRALTVTVYTYSRRHPAWADSSPPLSARRRVPGLLGRFGGGLRGEDFQVFDRVELHVERRCERTHALHPGFRGADAILAVE